MPWRFWFHQKVLADLWEESRSLNEKIAWIILKWRQGGISTEIVGFAFDFITEAAYRYSYHLAHNTDATTNIKKMALCFYRNLDPRKRPPMMAGTESGDLRFRSSAVGSILSGEELHSEMKFVVASSPSVANAQFAHLLHWSEVARTENARALWHEMEPIIKANIQIFESNAMGKTGTGEFFYEMWRQACGRDDCDPSEWRTKGSGAFRPIFLRCMDDKERTSAPLAEGEEEQILNDLSGEERDLVETEHMTAGQIKWRRDKLQQLGGRKDAFDMNYPLSPERAFWSSSTRYFDSVGIRKIKGSIEEPKFTGWLRVERPNDPLIDLKGKRQRVILEPDPNGPFRIYRTPVAHERPAYGWRYIMAGDAGTGRKTEDHPHDAGVLPFGVHSKACLAVLDRLRDGPYEGRIILTFLANVPEYEFGLHIAVAGLYAGWPILGVGNRTVGSDAFLKMKELGYPPSRIYISRWRGDQLRKAAIEGYWEDGKTRQFAYSELQEKIDKGLWEIYDDRFLVSLEACTGEHVRKKPHKKVGGVLDDPADVLAMLADMDKHTPMYQPLEKIVQEEFAQAAVSDPFAVLFRRMERDFTGAGRQGVPFDVGV